jgi:hypothetical protein
MSYGDELSHTSLLWVVGLMHTSSEARIQHGLSARKLTYDTTQAHPV